MLFDKYDILFLTPPVWDVHLPFAAVPQLMGACRAAEIRSRQVDLCISALEIYFELYHKELSRKFLTREYYDRRVAPWRDSPVKTFGEFLDRMSFLDDPDFTLERAKRIHHTGHMLEKTVVTAIITAVLKKISVSHNANTGVFDVADYFNIPQTGLMEKCLRWENLTEDIKDNARIIGISVTGVLQLYYMKELIEEIRSIKPGIKILLGGSAITLAVKSKDRNIDALLALGDYLIIGEGETAILRLVDCINNGGSLEAVPGLVYSDGEIRMNAPVPEDLNTIAKPCFDGIDFRRYALYEPMLPYHTSRGCFYGQCAFCNHDAGYRNNYREKPIDRVIDEILELVTETGVRHIQFTDEAIEPGYFKKLVYAMESNRDFKGISWLCYLRVSEHYDEETVNLAAKNGCRLALFGVETFNQRLLTFIKKGTNALQARRNLKLFHDAGIRTYAWFMYGLPSQTLQEAEEDVAAIEEISPYLDGMSNGPFYLSPNTDMLHAPEKYNISGFDINKGHRFTTYNSDGIIDIDEVRDAYRRRVSMLKLSKYFTGNRYDIFVDNLEK